MKSTIAFLFAICLITSGQSVSGSGTPHGLPFGLASLRSRATDESGVSASVIKGIQVFGESSGIAYTSAALYRTDDNGENWAELPLPQYYPIRLVSVWFSSETTGIALFADQSASRLVRYDTSDGGNSWVPVALNDEQADLKEDLVNGALDSAKIYISVDGTEILYFRLATSSNFHHTVYYSRGSGEVVWSHLSSEFKDLKEEQHFVSQKNDWEDIVKSYPGRINLVGMPVDPVVSRAVSLYAGYKKHSGWFLTQNGSCSGRKSGCVLTTRLYKSTSFTDENSVSTLSFKEITPPVITALNNAEKEAAKSEVSKTPLFALPPGGSTRISLNRGFDKCQAGSVAQMQLWWDNSYFFDSNIYFSGRNRACPSQPFTGNPAWITQVSAMGWGFIPTVVGYQSPCTASTTTAKLSYDPVVSEQQGRGEADIAVTDAANIGLTAGSILYYDMERYDPPTPDTLGCRTATIAFLKGWTDRVKELGYKSGTYGSPKNAQEDWQFIPVASRMDAIWMARWDNVPSVWTYLTFPSFPTNVWDNHQRIKQWQAPHNETWGGVTFNIDGNFADGPVAGVPVPRNKIADFDGDGKTDISVFRPSTGQWFISGSFGPTYNIYEFGVASDILTPGDFDGDGKTDFAVFRQSDSTWYVRAKGTFTVRQFGVPGDIPAAADYNGDGRTDIAVFRPSTGIWYFALSDSLNTFVTIPFGENGDKPVPADYDADGRVDIAVWRPSNGTWYVQGSAGSYFRATWGVSTDLPAQGDYDGDGKADFAVFRSGTWYLLQTTAGMYIQQFGIDGDIPATGDYDGDGRYDISVFRPSNSTWYLSQSQNGFAVREFGILNDKPIPTAYLPQ